MFSGVRKLGESQDMADDVTQDRDEGGDIDFVSVNYLSPDGGYPPQRISNYDEQLTPHQTLNDNGVSRVAAPFTNRSFLLRHTDVAQRTRTGAPRSGSAALTPEMAPQMARQVARRWAKQAGLRAIMRRR